MPDGDRDVLTSLPRSRPQRRSAKRDTPAAKAKAKAAKPKAAPRPKAAPKPKSAPRPKVKPRSAPGRKVPASGYAVPRDGSPVTPGGGELVSAAVQAVGELAQLGASVGARTLRDVLNRLPKP